MPRHGLFVVVFVRSSRGFGIGDRADLLLVAIGKRLLELKKKYPFIRAVRGRGLMRAMELAMPSRPFVQQALNRGLIINSTHDTALRFLPPLIVEKKHVDQFYRLMDEIFAETEWSGPAADAPAK